jgi:cation diffusion facilitator family transporter
MNQPKPTPWRSSDESSSLALSSVPLVGVAVNASLACVKILSGVFGNSYALIADGIESTADIVSSLVVWGGLRVAGTPANERHPYGYGKAEALAGVVAALGILVAALIIAIQAIREILTPHHLPHWSTLLILILVVGVKETLARWTNRVGEQADSVALQADAWHHRADAISSIAAFIGISIALIGGRGYEPADDWAALVACLVIAYSGLRLLYITARDILDAAPPKEVEDQVRLIAASIPGVKAVEKCRIRKSGTTLFVEIHIDGTATVDEGHRIGGAVRGSLRSAGLKIADAFVHIEPYFEPAAT